jgi:hypothetical protein
LDAATGVITVADASCAPLAPLLRTIAAPRDGLPMTVQWLCSRIVERFGFHPDRGIAPQVNLRNKHGALHNARRVLLDRDFGQSGVDATLTAECALPLALPRCLLSSCLGCACLSCQCP